MTSPCCPLRVIRHRSWLVTGVSVTTSPRLHVGSKSSASLRGLSGLRLLLQRRCAVYQIWNDCVCLNVSVRECCFFSWGDSCSLLCWVWHGLKRINPDSTGSGFSPGWCILFFFFLNQTQHSFNCRSSLSLEERSSGFDLTTEGWYWRGGRRI